MQMAGVREGAPGIRGTMWGSMNELQSRVSSDRRPQRRPAATKKIDAFNVAQINYARHANHNPIHQNKDILRRIYE